jgi:hypothetical protein
MVSAYRPSVLARHEGSCQPLAALQSPCCQRRLSRSYPCRKPIALPRKSVFAKAPALSQGITLVSGWLAPYGASSVPCNRLRPVVPDGIPLKGNRPRRVVPEVTPPFTFGSHSQQPKASPAPRFTAAASCISAASPASALSRLASSSPRTGLAPTRRCRGRCAMKPRTAPELQRWASKGMCHFVRSHCLPSVPSRLPAVAPVSARRVVPAVALAVRAAAARILCFRLAVGGPFVSPAFVPVVPPQASACPGSHGSALAFARPLSLGRTASVALVRRIFSSARRGRRIASADFRSTGVACGGGDFVSRLHRRSSALALARILGASRVQPRGPTRRSTPFPSVTGRCAMKPRSAGHLQR